MKESGNEEGIGMVPSDFLELENKREKILPGNSRSRIFNVQYIGRPNMTLEHEEVLSVEIESTTVDGMTNYGGPESVYKNKENQDSTFVGISFGGVIFAGVIDEVGGYEAKSMAGAFANKTVTRELVNNKSLTSALVHTHNKLSKEKNGDGHKLGTACAAIATIEENGMIRLAGIGDSQGFVLRNNIVVPESVTPMQNEAAEEIAAGISASASFYTHRLRNRVTNTLGTPLGSLKVPNGIKIQGERGDQIILATDGVWGVVSRFEVAELSKKYSGKALQEHVFSLAYCRQNGEKKVLVHGEDNVMGFFIQHDAITKVFVPWFPKHGDNITIIVMMYEPKE